MGEKWQITSGFYYCGETTRVDFRQKFFSSVKVQMQIESHINWHLLWVFHGILLVFLEASSSGDSFRESLTFFHCLRARVKVSTANID